MEILAVVIQYLSLNKLTKAFMVKNIILIIWNTEILLQFKIAIFYFNIFYNVMYSCDGSQYSSLQSHMMLQK